MSTPSDTLPKTPIDLRDAEGRAIDSAELARQDLNRARVDLLELKRTVARIAELGTTFARLAFRLTNLSLATTNQGMRLDPTSRALQTLVGRLEDMAHHCADTAQELDASVAAAVTSVDLLIELADQARRALEKLAPALDALASATSRASAPPSEPVALIVQQPTTTTTADAPTRTDRLADIIESGWPKAPGGDDPKRNN
jgi:uncharacterized coiled-coil protein SlyX